MHVRAHTHTPHFFFIHLGWLDADCCEQHCSKNRGSDIPLTQRVSFLWGMYLSAGIAGSYARAISSSYRHETTSGLPVPHGPTNLCHSVFGIIPILMQDTVLLNCI